VTIPVSFRIEVGVFPGNKNFLRSTPPPPSFPPIFDLPTTQRIQESIPPYLEDSHRYLSHVPCFPLIWRLNTSPRMLRDPLQTSSVNRFANIFSALLPSRPLAPYFSPASVGVFLLPRSDFLLCLSSPRAVVTVPRAHDRLSRIGSFF